MKVLLILKIKLRKMNNLIESFIQKNIKLDTFNIYLINSIISILSFQMENAFSKINPEVQK